MLMMDVSPKWICTQNREWEIKWKEVYLLIIVVSIWNIFIMLLTTNLWKLLWLYRQKKRSSSIYNLNPFDGFVRGNISSIDRLKCGPRLLPIQSLSKFIVKIHRFVFTSYIKLIWCFIVCKRKTNWRVRWKMKMKMKLKFIGQCIIAHAKLLSITQNHFPTHYIAYNIVFQCTLQIDK